MRKSYIFSHWIITLLVAPFISQALQYISGRNAHQVVGLLEVYPIPLMFSVVFSLPTFFVCLLCFYLLKKNNVDLGVSKIVLVAISVIGVNITISILKGSMSRDIAMAYSITAFVVGLLVRLKAENSYEQKHAT